MWFRIGGRRSRIGGAERQGRGSASQGAEQRFASPYDLTPPRFAR